MRRCGAVKRGKEASVATEVKCCRLWCGAFLQQNALQILLPLIERVKLIVVCRVLLRPCVIKSASHIACVKWSSVLNHAACRKFTELVWQMSKKGRTM